jgi:hypothetical protein
MTLMKLAEKKLLDVPVTEQAGTQFATEIELWASFLIQVAETKCLQAKPGSMVESAQRPGCEALRIHQSHLSLCPII